MASTSYLPLYFDWNASAALLRCWFAGGVQQNTSDAQALAAFQEIAARAESTEPVPRAAREDGDLGVTVLAQAPVSDSFASSAAPLMLTTGKRSTRASRRTRFAQLNANEVAPKKGEISRRLRREWSFIYMDDIARRAVEHSLD